MQSINYTPCFLNAAACSYIGFEQLRDCARHRSFLVVRQTRMIIVQPILDQSKMQKSPQSKKISEIFVDFCKIWRLSAPRVSVYLKMRLQSMQRSKLAALSICQGRNLSAALLPPTMFMSLIPSLDSCLQKRLLLHRSHTLWQDGQILLIWLELSVVAVGVEMGMGDKARGKA